MTERGASTVVVRIVVAGLAGLAAYASFYGRRNDYPGHFIAGFAATLLLLAVVAATVRRPLGWPTLAVFALAVGLGAITESTIFRLASFDPVDFFNQSIGAALAAGVALDQPIARHRTLVAGAAFVFLTVGFVLAFS